MCPCVPGLGYATGREMAVLLLAASLLAVLSGCARTQEAVYSELDLYASDVWRAGRRAVLIREQASLPEKHLLTLSEWLPGAGVPVMQVKCEPDSTSELCSLLSSHSVVVRREDEFIGFKDQIEKGDKDFVAAVMESLIGTGFHMITDYSTMKEFQDSNPQYILALARGPKGTFNKYLTFLKAILLLPSRTLPVVVTKQPMTLPLERRPKHSKGAQLFVWLVSDTMWCSYSNSTRPEEMVEGIHSFYHRLDHPFMLEYKSNQMTEKYKEEGLFTAYILYAPSKKKWAKDMATMLIDHYCNFFVFLVVSKKKNPTLSRALYLEPDDTNTMVVDPPTEEMNPIHLSLDEITLKDIPDVLLPVQQEYINAYRDNPETGKKGRKKGKVVRTDPRSLGHMAVDSTVDMLVAFCEKGDPQICDHFERSIQSVADIITTSMYQKQEMTFVLVESESEKEVERYGVDSFPFIGYFNATSGRWAEVQENNFQEIIDRALGVEPQPIDDQAMEALKQIDHTDSTDDKQDSLFETESASSPPPSSPPSSSSSPPPSPHRHHQENHPDILEDDDHFGQLVYSMGDPYIPPGLVLSEATFGAHINSHTATLVVFYVTWEPHCSGFIYHMLQAVEDLPGDSTTSMAVVDCGDYPSLCQQYSITHYPTALIFEGSPNDYRNYSAVTSSRQLLKVLERVSRGEEAEEVVERKRKGWLPELRADTLPHLLTQEGLSSAALVLWTTSQEGGGKENREIGTLTEMFSDYIFGWINCDSHGKVLKRVVSDFECRSVLLLDFSQRMVYQLPPSEWEADLSLSGAVQGFLEQFREGALSKSSELIRWAWPPQQPPIKFPSETFQRPPSQRPPTSLGQELQEKLDEDTMQALSSPPPPPPSHRHHHPHTEL